MNETLVMLAMVSLVIAGTCAVIIALDLLRRPQPMGIMNVVWPVTALYSGPLGLLAYFKIGRADAPMANMVPASAGGMSMPMSMPASASGGAMPLKQERPFWQKVLVGTTHCGAGCTIADIIGHWLIFLIPFALFGRVVFGAWTLDYILALAIGVLFQFAAIQPMLHLPTGEALGRAFKIDFLSLTAWQLGMYGWMALVIFVIFQRELPPTEPVFWFMMQLAMIAGFLTAYPVNWWLIRKGIKTAM